MARYQSIRRAGSAVVVVIDNIEHRLSETAFLALMEPALPVLQRLIEERDRRRAELAPVTERGPREVGGAVVIGSSREPWGEPLRATCRRVLDAVIDNYIDDALDGGLTADAPPTPTAVFEEAIEHLADPDATRDM